MNLCLNLNKNKNESVIVYKNKKKSDDICLICLDTFKKKQKISRIKNCGHIYHTDCLMLWFQRKVKCPICNIDLPESF